MEYQLSNKLNKISMVFVPPLIKICFWCSLAPKLVMSLFFPSEIWLWLVGWEFLVK